jgi:CRISPR-associated protein Cas5t
MITEIAEVEMKIPNNNVRIGKTLIPFPTQGIYGHLLALPQYFTNTIPREAIGTRPYYMLDKFIEYSPKSTQVLYDEELEWGVWIHE